MSCLCLFYMKVKHAIAPSRVLKCLIQVLVILTSAMTRVYKVSLGGSGLSFQKFSVGLIQVS